MRPFFMRIWHEVEPLLTHAIVVIILEVVILALALITHGIEQLIPSHEDLFEKLTQLEAYTALIVATTFAFYACLKIALILMKSLWEQMSK
jgi:hypothetical protein